MSSWPILTIPIDSEGDVVAVRQRAKRIAELIGFEIQDQTRVATAVSEIARNAFEYAGRGQTEFQLENTGEGPQSLAIAIRDDGPGVADAEAVLDGRHNSPHGLGIGITGARRLVDEFLLETLPGQGTLVVLRKHFSRRQQRFTRESVERIAAQLAKERTPPTPLAGLAQQNAELARGLDELRNRQDELTHLSRELEDTNRGVVALHGELEQKAEELRLASELKTRFLSHMSHEFRTPLNSILALSELLIKRVDGDLSSEQERQVSFIRRSAESLYELVNDLLDIAKLEAGRVDIRLSTFSAQDLLAGLRGVMKPLQKSDDVQLVFEEPDARLPLLTTDEGKVVQIIRNFVSNALKFTLRGEVRVSATLSSDGENVEFAVHDTGIGIEKKDRERIFDEFSQIDSPTQRHVKGTGLGLALSRKLAEVLKGYIELESEVGKGSRFTLSIPAKLDVDAKPQALVLPMEPVANGAVSGRPEAVVLIVDDDPAFRYTLRQMIGKGPSAYNVIEAHNGFECLEKARDLHPDVIVLDIQMPGRDGYDVLADLSEDPHTRTIPVILSSSADYDTLAHERIGQARAFLSKREVSSGNISNVLDRVLDGLQ